MNFSLLRKLYFISLFAHWMQYLKKSKEFSLEFLILLGFNVFAIQPYFVAWSIACWLCMLVVILLLKLLYMLKILSIDSFQLFQLGY